MFSRGWGGSETTTHVFNINDKEQRNIPCQHAGNSLFIHLEFTRQEKTDAPLLVLPIVVL